jgi:hypothetical protein
MKDFESKLASLQLRRPSQGLDDRVRSAKPEQTETEQLNRQLLEQSQPTDGKELKMRMSMFARVPPMMRLAAGLLVAIALVGSGWAAEKVYKKMTQLVVQFEDDKDSRIVCTGTLPDGTTWERITGTNSSITVPVSDDPAERQIAIQAAKQEAQQEREEIKKLALERKYEFVGEHKQRDGMTCYTYKFQLANGKEIEEGFYVRLENVASWEEYIQKAKEARVEHMKAIDKAVDAGRFRLLDVHTYQVQLCRDVKTGHKQRVQRCDRRSGSIAHITNENAPSEEESWQDHLQAIREGRRELLGLDDHGRDYTYEVTLDDGSKVIDSYGGNRPLKKLADPEEWSYKALGHE